MKALYITNRVISKDLDLGYLSHFADKEDILPLGSTDEAKKYVLHHLAELQQHLDFIVIDMVGVEDEIMDEFAIWMSVQGLEYSNNNFRVSSIPLIMVRPWDWEWALNGSRSFLYTKTFYENSDDTVKQALVGTAISQWMQNIGNDLAHFNMDLTLRFDPKKLNWLLEHRAYKLEVLTETFFRKMKTMPYIWFGNNLKTFDVSFSRFDDLLRMSERRPSLRNEKEIHAYLLANRRLLLGEFYTETHYEKQYYLANSRQYVEPDFTNMPYSFYDQLPEIFEVKLPNQRLVRTDKKVFYRDTARALHQVSLKYGQFFADPKNSPEVAKRIGYGGNDFTHTLLIGRKKEKEENQAYLAQMIGGLGLRLLTYDELPENYQRLYERTRRYNLS
jgi:hypothetical protein